MKISKNSVLFAFIAVVVFFSGCTGNQETRIAENAPSTPVQTTVIQPDASETPAVPYQVQVTEIKTLKDCIVSGGTTPCSIINLEVKNNNIKNLDFKILKEEIVSKGGKQLGNRYDREVGLSNSCVRQSGMEFKLNANAYQNVALCYPVVHKSDAPALNVAALINGERKEYKFDLIKYGLPDQG